jgi:hypothetical protein
MEQRTIMDEPISFRFLAPDEDLPAPLPTVAVIKASKGPNVLDDRRGSYRVVHVNNYFVVKYGRRIDLLEGENMLFVKRSTNIRIPKLYATFTEVFSNINFIIMEHIPGKVLENCWGTLNIAKNNSSPRNCGVILMSFGICHLPTISEALIGPV